MLHSVYLLFTETDPQSFRVSHLCPKKTQEENKCLQELAELKFKTEQRPERDKLILPVGRLQGCQNTQEETLKNQIPKDPIPEKKSRTHLKVVSQNTLWICPKHRTSGYITTGQPSASRAGCSQPAQALRSPGQTALAGHCCQARVEQKRRPWEPGKPFCVKISILQHGTLRVSSESGTANTHIQHRETYTLL